MCRNPVILIDLLNSAQVVTKPVNADNQWPHNYINKDSAVKQHCTANHSSSNMYIHFPTGMCSDRGSINIEWKLMGLIAQIEGQISY